MVRDYTGKLYLITGGSGFLGKYLTQRVLTLGGKVRCLSRNEGSLITLKQKHPDIEIYPGDVSDAFEVQQAMEGVDGVFHLAASKHVLLAEQFTRECIKTNVIGALNILEQSLHQPLDFVLSISTDKACQVSGVYGATKFLLERLSKQYEKLNRECSYRVVRYGNVLYSTGSVLCKWKELIQNGDGVIITDPDATRFFWTAGQAIDLIFDCLLLREDSSPYCPFMKSVRMGTLLDAMIDKYGGGKEIPVEVIGLQDGENLHEKMLEEGSFSNEVQSFSLEELKEIL